MEGWDLLRSLHIKVNVIGMLGSPALQVGRAPAGWGGSGEGRTGSQGQWGSSVGGET